MPEFIKHYEMPKPLDVTLDNVRFTSELKFEVNVINLQQMLDTVIVNAIINEAKLRGVSDMYLVDGDFVVEAIKEKIERENKNER